MFGEWREERKARDQGWEVLGDVLFLASILSPFLLCSAQSKRNSGGWWAAQDRGPLFEFEFPFFFASAFNICNVVRYEQGPRGGAVSSVGVKTGQRKGHQRAKGGGEILVSVQEKSSSLQPA